MHDEKRWNSRKMEYAPRPDVEAFLSEIGEVCRRRGMSLSHEDTHGAFMVEQFSENLLSWLMAASVDMAQPATPIATEPAPDA